MQNFYQNFIAPRATNQNSRNREMVLNYLLLGSITLAFLALVNTAISFIFFDYYFLVSRIIAIAVVAALFSFLYFLAHYRQQQNLASFLLVALFFLTGTYLAYQWSAVTPTGVLVFGFTIVMAGVLLGSRYSLYAAAATLVVLTLLQYLQATGDITTDLSWMQRQPTMGDIIGFSAIYAILALTSWLFNRQMEQSLQRAQKSEAALSRQKALLEIKVEERTRELEAAQVEKMKQVYRFAELGRVSSALFHDLANHLASVSLDIEGLEPKGRSKIMQRIQQDIHYIDDVVQRVRFQLRGQSEIERFNVMTEINRIVKIMTYQTVQARVVIETQQSGTKPIHYTGDITRFRQLVSNLLANAVEAYPTPKNNIQHPRKVELRAEQTSDSLVISVKDYGMGIKKSQQTKVFEPFFTDKNEGTGIGLFIVKQIAEQDLGGTIELMSSPQTGTEFTVTLPLKP